MKTIKLNEDQFLKLVEANGVGAQAFDGGDLREYPGSQVQTTAVVHDSDGELEYGKQPTTDKIQNMLSIQNFWANGRRGTRPM